MQKSNQFIGIEPPNVIHGKSIKTSISKHLGIFKKEDALDGVYILTEKGNCILHDLWGDFKEKETAIGIAVIEGEHKLVVALNGSEEDIILAEEYNYGITGEYYQDEEDAKKDWNGKENTRLLAEKGDSQAAKYCLNYECGNIKKGSWWLPSYKEMDMLYQNNLMIDACLSICGGNILPKVCHWTSTEYSSSSTWVMGWGDGNTNIGFQDIGNRVHLISALL